MTDFQFEVSDIVMLKSGGPPMTVTALTEDRTGLKAMWMTAENVFFYAFPSDALELVSRDAPVEFGTPLGGVEAQPTRDGVKWAAVGSTEVHTFNGKCNHVFVTSMTGSKCIKCQAKAQ